MNKVDKCADGPADFCEVDDPKRYGKEACCLRCPRRP